MSIGFFESLADGPAHDQADTCAVCGALLDESREHVALVIHCTRWPLATFVRVHRDEALVLTVDDQQRALVAVAALEERQRIESARTDVPNAFLDAFS